MYSIRERSNLYKKNSHMVAEASQLRQEHFANVKNKLSWSWLSWLTSGTSTEYSG